MSKPNKRRVRMDQFKSQVVENLGDNFADVELGGEHGSVRLRLGVAATSGPTQEAFEEALNEHRESGDTDAMCLEILSHNNDATGEEQWERWKEAGYDSDDLAMVFFAETAAYRDRLGKFRYKP